MEVTVRVKVGEGVMVGVRDGRGDGVIEGVNVKDGVNVGVRVRLGRGVGVTEGVWDGVGESEPVGLGVGVGVRVKGLPSTINLPMVFQFAPRKICTS